jgi:hypothetical protein
MFFIRIKNIKNDRCIKRATVMAQQQGMVSLKLLIFTKKILDFVPSNEKKVFFSSQKCFLFSGPPILRLEILRSSYLSIPAEGGRGWIIIAFLSLDLKFHLLARREVRKSCKKVSLKENQAKKVFLE